MTETKQPSTPNHHLRRERERRAWSQQDLADEVGTTPLNVSRWERGVTTPSPYFRQKLCEVFEKNAQELGLVAQSDGTASVVQTTSIDETSPSAPASPESPAKIWNVPYRHNPFFTGREDVLSYLRETLLAGQQPVALTQPQAISGLGGIGKTQTAIEYAYRHREEYQSVFWARAESRDLLISDFLTIAALLNLPQRNDQEQEAIVRAVLHWLDTHEGWLLILDNADTLEIVSEFFPSAGTGHILLTTRSHSLGTLAQRIDLEKMSLDEGLLFLLRRTKQLKGAARLESVSESIRIAAQAIVEALDGLPLALDQAGAYIEETGCSLSDYLKYYKTRQQRLLRTRGRDASGHPEPVATTWSLAFEKVEQANPAAAELLRVCAFLHPDEIPESMIIEGASDLSPVLQSATEDELDWNEAIRQLRRYSLLKRDAEEKILNIHRLVQAVVRDGMSQEERKEQVQRVVLMVNRTFPNGQVESWPVCQRYQPHMLVCADMIKQWQLKSIEATQLLMHGGTYLRERGRYKEAEPLLEQALTIREQTLGPKHLDVARSQEELSKLYFFQGKYAEAEALLKHLLFVYESTLNSEDKEIANVLSDLGVLYHYQGKNREAEPLLLRALHILELTEEGEIAGLLSDLGLVYQSLGDYTQSEQFHQRALALDENKFGLDHINVAGDMNNLAILFFIQGRYIQAEQMRRKALEIAEKTLGPDHLYVSIALANLTTLHIQLVH